MPDEATAAGDTPTWSVAALSPTLVGDVVTLEPLSLAHEDALFEAARPAEIWDWWQFRPASDREAFRRYVAEAIEAAAAGQEGRFAVLDRGGEPIGSSGYLLLRPEHRGLEIGWTWFTPSAWGSGANTETKLLMLRHAFEVLACRRVEFHTDERNARSRAALEKLPARLDGVLRDYRRLPDGGWRSNAVYSVLAEEWPAVEEALMTRLARQTAGDQGRDGLAGRGRG
jgi:RimJ/RimL family protein N-acetyltransferase